MHQVDAQQDETGRRAQPNSSGPPALATPATSGPPPGSGNSRRPHRPAALGPGHAKTPPPMSEALRRLPGQRRLAPAMGNSAQPAAGRWSPRQNLPREGHDGDVAGASGPHPGPNRTHRTKVATPSARAMALATDIRRPVHRHPRTTGPLTKPTIRPPEPDRSTHGRAGQTSEHRTPSTRPATRSLRKRSCGISSVDSGSVPPPRLHQPMTERLFAARMSERTSIPSPYAPLINLICAHGHISP